jgi:DNA polymerase-3 subunit alpha (Gram-positive type)
MTVIFYDFETTGLNWFYDQIIEIAAETNGNKFEELCNIGNTMLPYIVTKITGLTGRDLKDAEPEAKVLKDFCQFVRKAGENGKKQVYLVAHNNANFDMWFLKSRASEHQIRLPSRWRYVDSLLLAKLVYPGRNSYSLKNLCLFLDVEQIQAHRAGDDVRCLREIFMKMVNDFKYKFNISGTWDESVEMIWKKTTFQ